MRGGGKVRFLDAFLPICLIFVLWVPRAFSESSTKYCSNTADNVVVYVDKTTPYDEIDKKALIDGVSRLFENLKGGERFSMRTIAESFPMSASLLDECVPICEDTGLFADLFGSCTEGVVIKDKKHLRDAVVRQLQVLLNNFVELPNSEIVRTLSLSSPIELREGRTNRLYLFTDLIENSVYLPGKQFFSEENSVLIDRVINDKLVPDMSGVVVQVFGVGRGGNPGYRHTLDQKLLNKLLDFWTRYFAAARATVSIQQSLGAFK
jgi:hypothetical protein